MRVLLATTTATALVTLSGVAAAAAPHTAPARQSEPADASVGRVAALGELLGPRAASAAFTWVTPRTGQAADRNRDVDAGAGEQMPGTGLPALTGMLPGTGALTLSQVRAQHDLAQADASAGDLTPIGQAPAVPVGPLDAPLTPGGVAAPVPGVPVATTLGPLVCPVAGQNSFTDTFGAPRSGGRSHQGTDVMAASGTPVVALAASVVVQINPVDTPGSLGGITLSYTTANGDRWYNAHLSALAPGLRTGQYLAAGQTFGYVGNTGDARYTASHLHIERHPGGASQAVDAYPDLHLACR